MRFVDYNAIGYAKDLDSLGRFRIKVKKISIASVVLKESQFFFHPRYCEDFLGIE